MTWNDVKINPIPDIEGKFIVFDGIKVAMMERRTLLIEREFYDMYVCECYSKEPAYNIKYWMKAPEPPKGKR